MWHDTCDKETNAWSQWIKLSQIKLQIMKAMCSGCILLNFRMCLLIIVASVVIGKTVLRIWPCLFRSYICPIAHHHLRLTWFFVWSHPLEFLELGESSCVPVCFLFQFVFRLLLWLVQRSWSAHRVLYHSDNAPLIFPRVVIGKTVLRIWPSLFRSYICPIAHHHLRLTRRVFVCSGVFFISIYFNFYFSFRQQR